jgi:hypothetical protein
MSKGLYAIFKTKADMEYHDLCIKTIMQQQTLDCMIIALHREFGFGSTKFKRLQTAFETVWAEMCEMANEDVRNDKEIAYSKAKIDEALLQAVGKENFVKWEDRYKL